MAKTWNVVLKGEIVMSGLTYAQADMWATHYTNRNFKNYEIARG